MANKNTTFSFRSFLIFIFIFLMGGIASAQTQPKVQKNGKLKAKKHQSLDHHTKVEKMKKHHNIQWNHHSKQENQAFSKKKKKKK